MLIAHKIALKPNNAQCTFFWQCAGIARKAYNWALAEWKKQYENGEKPSEINLRKQLNAIKREEFPYMLDVPKSVVQQSIKNLGSAYKHFFRKLKEGKKVRPQVTIGGKVEKLVSLLFVLITGMLELTTLNKNYMFLS